ncbi:MAG: cell division protein FtsZ [Chloroflexi bacterium]|nr:cell division protein FtsZ [Chloroflexota bacterium]
MIENLFSRIDRWVTPKGEPIANGRSSHIKIKVVGVGGAGGNAVVRMLDKGLGGVGALSLNTDVQALSRRVGIRSFAIGPETTNGMGSGGRPEVGRKAIKESQRQVAELLAGTDLVFVTCGMGGGTGTGAAPVVADIARRQGALTVGVVTLPFSFEGPRRRKVAEQGIVSLRQKVDTLIAVENDRLLPSLDGEVSLSKALEAADEVLHQGVRGISELITLSGMINVDFADVRSIMTNGGPSFLATGEGKGKWAAMDAARQALANPLFDAPIEGAAGILFNVTGGKDLTLGQVHEVAEVIGKAAGSDANVIFGVRQDTKMKKRVRITLVATGIPSAYGDPEPSTEGGSEVQGMSEDELAELLARPAVNGNGAAGVGPTQRLL